MSVLESWLTNIWYGSKKPPLALRILSRIYAYVIGKLAPITIEKLPVPIVVVGNFTVGGTGKTPLIIALAEYLSSQGYCPGVISRGYSRKTKTPISVDASSTVEQVGDEPFLIARRATVPVRVDAERFRAAQFLIAHGCNIIISDDGLQHRALPRTLEIEVLDTQRGYGNGLLLPAGPLREPIRPVALRVLNGSMTDTDTA